MQPGLLEYTEDVDLPETEQSGRLDLIESKSRRPHEECDGHKAHSPQHVAQLHIFFLCCVSENNTMVLRRRSYASGNVTSEM